MRNKKDELYAVINIGSSHITGLLAQKDGSRRIDPIAYSIQDSGDSVKYGKIFNTDEVHRHITTIIDELAPYVSENYTIGGVYLGIECLGMRLSKYSIWHEEAEHKNHRVRAELIERMRQEIYTRVPEDYVAIQIESPLVRIDDRDISPERIEGTPFKKKLELTFPTIEVERDAIDLLTELFDSLSLPIKGIFATPIVEAKTTLRSGDLLIGSVYVNIGGECTSISIYKDSRLQELYILPLGGENITRDLMSLRLTHSVAEALKRQHGGLDTGEISNQMIKINGVGNRDKEVSEQEIIMYCDARMREIIGNVFHIVKEAGYGDISESNDIYFSGGATRINNFESEIAPISYILDSYITESVDDLKREQLHSCIALAYHAEESCLVDVTRDMESLTEDIPTSMPTETPEIEEAESASQQSTSTEEVTFEKREARPSESGNGSSRRGSRLLDNVRGIFSSLGGSRQTQTDDDDYDEDFDEDDRDN